MELESDSFVLEKFKEFLAALKDSDSGGSATEKTVDGLFKRALELDEIFQQEEKTRLNELLRENYPSFNFSKPVDLLIENIIKSQNFDEELTSYAINTYTLLYSKEQFSEILKKLLAEVGLRSHLYTLIEECPDVDLDLYSLNNFLSGLMSGPDLQSKVQNALKSETSLFLKSLRHADSQTAQTLVDEMITCLESQTDLKLWFLLMNKSTIHFVLDLSVLYKKFLNAILRFFDRFADEMESIYDEDLNDQYSHVNMDFEDFVKIFQLFLNKDCIKNVILEFLDSKTVTKKNYLFWVDVKSCL